VYGIDGMAGMEGIGGMEAMDHRQMADQAAVHP